MEFIKKNYEKIILGVVLLGLVGVVAFMPVMIFYDQQKTKEFTTSIIHPHVEPLPPLDLSRQDAVFNRLKLPGELDFSTTNKLFNPVLWQKTKEGILRKGTDLGPNKAVVTKIMPLYFSISLDSVMTNTGGDRYVFVVTNEAAAQPALRHAKRFYVSVGEKKEAFTLKGVKGPPDNPTELVLILADTGRTATLSPDHPFQRVDGYTADLKYDPENFHAAGLRVGDHISFAGDDFNVIDIQSNSVELSAQSNQKNYTLPYAP